jgi:hypothetical protein
MEIRRYRRNSDLISENFEILLEIRHRRNSDFEILAAGFPVYLGIMLPMVDIIYRQLIEIRESKK